MTKANITIVLVPEALSKNKRRIEREIARSLQCDWLLKIEKVTISNHPIPNNKNTRHHRMPDDKEITTNG
jgi:hypothetical protein